MRFLSLSGLSARERDCLRLVGSGLGAKGVASELGITHSTVEKHLASARQKLGVSKTIEAVICLVRQEPDRSRKGVEIEERSRRTKPTLEAMDIAEKIALSETKDEAWRHLTTGLKEMGFRHSLFGFIAEPSGQVTNGTRIVENALSIQVRELFEVDGAEHIGPVPNGLTSKTTHFVSESSHHIEAFSRRFPGRKREVIERILDESPWQFLNVPGADRATGAPYCLTLRLERCATRVSFGEANRMIENARLWTAAYWGAVKSAGHLVRLSGLTQRQIEVLKFAARGFRIEETAEQMGISCRSAEKLLQLSRSRIGARTTASAVFRASVFGALT